MSMADKHAFRFSVVKACYRAANLDCLSVVYETMTKTKTKIRAVAATGNLSTGFREESLVRAVEQGASFVGCDAGTTDSGPYYLGSGKPRGPREGVKRNLRLVLREALKIGRASCRERVEISVVAVAVT